MVQGFFGQFAAAADETAQAQVPWAGVMAQMQDMVTRHMGAMTGQARAPSVFGDPVAWVATAQGVLSQLPLADPEKQAEIWQDVLGLVQEVLGQYGVGEGEDAPEEPTLPRRDARFADPKWRQGPFFALVHQLYLLLSERVSDMAEETASATPWQHEQLVFATHALLDAMSPANFALTNPVALDKAAETRGQSLIDGMEHLLADLSKGQLTQTSDSEFVLGENIADTPGKVVHETPLFQLIQYTPTTKRVLRTPLVIFPPWINRFYILDLNAKKSFVRWCLDQGITVFMTSWKSADATLGEVVWDDYIAAQIEAIDVACARLKVPSAHVIGYCVAGTTLAATLAILARRGEAEKVKSATFFTAQVDFTEAGDLKHFIDDERQVDLIEKLSPEGYVDGRYLAAAFNLLRPRDLIWPYVEKNYLGGEDYKAFDLLYWNSDYTNLPAKWHHAYLCDLYRDNRLALPDELSALGTPIDLRRIETPTYIQAGKEDHIAPPQSVWKLTRHLGGPWTFVLAGSGHIAGVVNPPSANKYQYWTNDGDPASLEEFRAGATEHPGSWWPHWQAWLREQDPAEVDAKGKRKPGGKGEASLEDAPGRYVMTR
ncbi:MAG: alpha/beta fold hydrolase [Sphingomonadaceae bacterium]